MENNVQNAEYQRIEQVKKFLNIQKNTDLAVFFDIKNSQIFSEIKRGKSGISKKLATTIVDKVPALNYSWVLSGEGTMLRQEGVNVVANNSDNTAATISVGNTTSDADTGRWLALYESQQKERAELVAIISKLTDKLTALLTAGVAVLLLSAATACNKKDNGCHWEAVPTTHYVRALDYAPATTLDSTLYCDGVAVVTRTPSWAQ